jgi:signal recognition particle subunit SRP54
MLDTVAKGFKAAKNRLTGKAEITEEVVDEALRDIRVSLLEADVSFEVVKRFVAKVKDKAVGEVVTTKATDKAGKKVRVSPQDAFIKICHDELEALMGPVDVSLKLPGPLASIMMVGLQGSGKTTTAGKLANKLLKQGKKPLLVAADIYRPAAVEQLKVLGARLDVPVYHEAGLLPPELCKRGMEEARRLKRDVVIFDTAGRLAIDDALMAELEAIKAGVAPNNILLVCDAMIGQDAVKTAAEFDRRLSLDGFILTKLDGDARGGAALSIKEVTGKPIKFLGMGEGMDKLEEFRPEGLAGRILGFGDIVGLMKDFEGVVDQQKAEEDAQKILSGNFTLTDFVDQIRLVRKMGDVKELLEKFPIFGDQTAALNIDDKELLKIEAMYQSMTAKERLRPDLFTESRIKRVAAGSGRKFQEVKDLLERYKMMQQVMGQIGKQPGLLGMLPGFKQFANLKKMQGMDLGSMFGGAGMGGLGDMMGGMQMPQMSVGRGMQAPMSAAQMNKARLMGYTTGPVVSTLSADEKKRLKDKKKKEKESRKKNRKKR